MLNGIETHFNAEGNIELPTVLQLGIYHIAQEALNNVLKHASASDVSVHLARDGHRVEMEIEDNGSGFDVHESSAGIGLQSMRERAEALGGVLCITSKTGAGTSPVRRPGARPPGVSQLGRATVCGCGVGK